MNIEFKNVYFSYCKDTQIENMSFKIEKGEFTAFIGENGAGKTTIVKLCSGLIKPQSGSVLIDGVSTDKMKISSLAGRVGFLFQNPDRQIFCDTALDEVMFTPRNIGLDCEKKAHELLEKFGIPEKSVPFNLSRGQRQMLALISVIVTEPEILIIDEPTTGLDYTECTRIMETVSELNKKGTTVIAVCHDMELVLDYMKRVIVVEKGKIAADGNCLDIFQNDAVMERASIIPPQIICLAKATGMDNVSNAYEAEEYIIKNRKSGVSE